MSIADLEKTIQTLAVKVEGLGVWMLGFAEEAASEERATHAYVNRTWNLETSTQARLEVDSPDVTEVVLEMGMEYASYITDGTYDGGGPSLSNFKIIGADLGVFYQTAVHGYFQEGGVGFASSVVTVTGP